MFKSIQFALSSALARVLYSAGAKVILASRNLHQLERLKFELDSEPRLQAAGKVLNVYHKGSDCGATKNNSQSGLVLVNGVEK